MSREKSASYTGNGAAEATAITGRVTSGVRPATTSCRSMLAPHSRTGAATRRRFAHIHFQDRIATRAIYSPCTAALRCDLGPILSLTESGLQTGGQRSLRLLQ